MVDDMICDRANNKTLTCNSSYDSSRHLGFNITMCEDGCWTQESADKFLTDEQIKMIELVILSMAKSFILSEST